MMSSPNDLLNTYQLRRVRIILQSFEEDLLFALLWLDHGSIEGSLYQFKMDLSSELRERARERILEGLAEVRSLAAILELEPEVENAARRIMGSMNIDWESLNEMRASSLKGFGDIHPEVGKILDGPADRMAKIALSLSNIFMQGPANLTADTHPSKDKENET